MTDQTIPVEKLRALLDQWRPDETHDDHASGLLEALYDLLPPALPDPLFLAKATHPEYGEGIVGSHFPDGDGDVRFMFRGDGASDGTMWDWAKPSTLAFHAPDMFKNGAGIDTSTAHVDPIDTRPDHPRFLETEGDYRSAPEGTIVAQDECGAFVLVGELWRHIGLGGSDPDVMAGDRRRVLRWGWKA